ncbi:hypothetical protein DPMN_100995 [Dreissena polymorpha]|uniref:MAM domain-containing protein n=1 Tax=Dreissena polymorpha TaxID=45954 RepID=A0A9D4LJ56_DREPO|nr:hypothetical protein DPMN_100995 [Dreissena polymorpha]
MESSAPTVHGDNAMLRSPEINTTGSSGICLNFWYSMNGDSIGSLKVYIEEAGTRRLIWSLSGHQGTEWRNASVPLHSNQNVHVRIDQIIITLHSLSLIEQCLTILLNKIMLM